MIAERSAVNGALIPSRLRERCGRGEERRLGLSAVKCCLLDTVSHCTHSLIGNYSYLHKLKSTRLVNAPTGSINWTKGHTYAKGGVRRWDGGC